MTASLLPLTTARAVTVLLVAVATFLTAAHALLLGHAASRTALGERARVAVPALVAAYLALWFGAGEVLADQAHFPLVQPALVLPFGLALMLLPMAIAATALFVWRPLAAVNSAMPPSWLIRLQVYRVAGLIFLFPFLYYGAVPAAFAVTAAVGDVLTGSLALPVAALVERRGRAAFGWARAWNALGILDLLVVPTLGVLTGAQVINQYPLALVPLFIGPPLGILTHIYSLRNLSRNSEQERASRSAAGATLQAA